MSKFESACSGVLALELNPGSAEPEAMPTVPLEPPTAVKPASISTTVRTTRTIGSMRLISISSFCRYFSDVMSFALCHTHRGLDHCSHSLGGGQEQHQKDGEHAHSNRNRAPEQAHEGGRNSIGFDTVSGQDIILRPSGNITVIEGLNFSPPHKSQQRLVIGVVDKHVLQAVAVRVFQHGAK